MLNRAESQIYICPWWQAEGSASPKESMDSIKKTASRCPMRFGQVLKTLEIVSEDRLFGADTFQLL
jgi:hypothetical protein